MTTGGQERAEAHSGAVDVSADVGIRAARHSAEADELVGPPSGDGRSCAQIAPAITEGLDVGNLVGLIGIPQAFEPSVARLGVGRCRGDDPGQRVDGVVDG